MMQSENSEILEYIKEFLRYNNFSNTVECLEAEIKTKQFSGKLSTKQNAPSRKEDLPRIYSLMKDDGNKSKRELNMEKDMKNFNKKYKQILQAGRQIFSVSIQLLQLLHSLKEVKL